MPTIVLVPLLSVAFIAGEVLVIGGLVWLLSSERASCTWLRLGHLLAGQFIVPVLMAAVLLLLV